MPQNLLPVYQTNATAADRLRNNRIMNQQLQGLNSGKFPTCPDCCKKINPHTEAFRCIYCGIFFCGSCAQHHFGMATPPYATWAPSVNQEEPTHA